MSEEETLKPNFSMMSGTSWRGKAIISPTKGKQTFGDTLRQNRHK